MTLEEMQIRRTQIRGEFDRLMWRKRRIDERLDALAKLLDTLGVEITAARVQRDYPPPERPPLRMEIL